MLAMIQEAASATPLAMYVVAGTLVVVAMLKRNADRVPSVLRNPKIAAWVVGIGLHFLMKKLGLGAGEIDLSADATAGAMEALLAQVLYKHGAGDVLRSVGLDE